MKYNAPQFESEGDNTKNSENVFNYLASSKPKNIKAKEFAEMKM